MSDEKFWRSVCSEEEEMYCDICGDELSTESEMDSGLCSICAKDEHCEEEQVNTGGGSL